VHQELPGALFLGALLAGAMRPLFRGDGCTANEAGISTAGNPLSRMFDAATNDPLHARQIREGFRPPMGGPMLGPEGQMLDPMMAKGSLEEAWAATRPPMPGGPMLGASMPDQFMRHMQRPAGPAMQEPGFFSQGPMGAGPGCSIGDDWAQEFGAGPSSGPQGLVGPPAMRPPGAEWASEFAPMRPPMPGPMEMEAAFQQAQMEAAFAEAAPPPGHAAMEAAFQQAQGPVDMEAAFQQANMEAAFAEAQQEVLQERQSLSEQADLAQAAQMVEMLRNSGNPKFANSQFVSFIDKVSKGDLQFKENTVIDRQGNEVDWDTLYDTEAATASASDTQELEQLWQASGPPQEDGQVLEQLWKASESQEDGAPGSELEEMWRAATESGDPAELERLWKGASQEALDAAWANAGDVNEAALLEQAWLGEDLNMDQIWRNPKQSEYQFQGDNEYLDSEDPLAEAQRLLKLGRDREALKALEAEVQRNPESSEGWRQLGQLFAELDQDIEAIQCLRRGHEVDPYNLESLLALGVSCTNELDQLPALRYLRLWVENHEDHQVLVQGLDPPPEYEYEQWRQQVTALFNQAAQANPLDADVFVALGVMENINRNYDAAVGALAAACRLRPNDHTVWNKLGATLANSGKSEQAVVAYHQGLQLKPNYARSWSNLAIAHANLGQHTDAARFYLSSLVLNPDAVHIWNFLHSAVLNMGEVNAYDAIDKRDLHACTQLIDGVLDPNQLPLPKEELENPADEILGSIGL